MAILTIGGVAMPSPTEMTVSVQDISKADRNANGTMVLERIATKQKLACKWSAITATDLKTILSAISPTTYNITYINPVTNASETKNMYCGDRSMGVIQYTNGVPIYKDFTVDFIEI